MPKTSRARRLSFKLRSVCLLTLCLVMALSFGIAKPSHSVASTSDELRSKANDLQAQINANKVAADQLSVQADSLKKTIAGLDVQISQATAQIQLTDIKIAQLQDQLDKTQKELDRQKGLLKASMRALYKKQGASTVELLVGSDTFTEFIDQQEYLDRLKANIQTSAEQVIGLKRQIEQQQVDQKKLRDQQELQKQELASSKSDREAALNQTQGDEARYRSIVDDLKNQQAAVNKALFAQIRLERGDGNNGGYPYDNWAFSMTPFGCGAGEGPDRWGYCTRQCVSYAAWAVERSGRNAPLYYGNARDWLGAASAHGIAYDHNAHVGDVAIYASGGYGHAAYVEAVYGDGTMRVSQYNAALDGRYSEATVSTNVSYLYFIHFP